MHTSTKDLQDVLKSMPIASEFSFKPLEAANDENVKFQKLREFDTMPEAFKAINKVGNTGELSTSYTGVRFSLETNDGGRYIGDLSLQPDFAKATVLSQANAAALRDYITASDKKQTNTRLPDLSQTFRHLDRDTQKSLLTQFNNAGKGEQANFNMVIRKAGLETDKGKIIQAFSAFLKGDTKAARSIVGGINSFEMTRISNQMIKGTNIGTSMGEVVKSTSAFDNSPESLSQLSGMKDIADDMKGSVFPRFGQNDLSGAIGIRIEQEHNQA